MTEVYLVFYRSVFPLFTRFNKLLQREDPAIYLLYSQMRIFLKNLIRFIKPQIITEALEDLRIVDYQDPSSQLEDSKVYVGILTRSKLNKLVNEGDISPYTASQFVKGAKVFYTTAVSYALSHLPFDDEVLLNAQFVNIENRLEANFSHVAYLVERFNDHLPYSDVKSQELLFTQFTKFQTMPGSAIPVHISEDAKVREKNDDNYTIEYYRMDKLWAYLSHVRDSVTGHLSYSLLVNVSKLVLTLPHSNADEERIFSLVKMNKTDFRSALSLDGSLASILTLKWLAKRTLV